MLVIKSKPLHQVWLTDEEIFLIEVVRKIIWGNVEVIIKNGEVKVIKKVVETYNLSADKVLETLSKD